MDNKYENNQCDSGAEACAAEASSACAGCGGCGSAENTANQIKTQTCSGCVSGGSTACQRGQQSCCGCSGSCPRAAENEFQWDYDDTVLVFSSDMLEEEENK